mmetsp:Transcript_25504/g.70445  ORF Transcript_25504/g.70445 Transcript_25504/m.70445 type:complete len:222 (+) Transcript_25504:321-986(+)
MCEIKPINLYVEQSVESSSGGSDVDPAAARVSAFSEAAIMRASTSSMCEKSQSAARSEAPLVSFKANRTWSTVKQPSISTREFTAASSTPEVSLPPLLAAPAAGSGNGSLKSGSVLCSKTHPMAASTLLPPTAFKARLQAFSENPISMSCATAPWSIVGAADGAAASLLVSSSFGTSSSFGCGPPSDLYRAKSTMKSPDSKLCGTSKLTCSLMGCQSGPSV